MDGINQVRGVVGSGPARPRVSGGDRLGDGPGRFTDGMSSIAITVYGVCAGSFMMAMYALERRGRAFIIAFAIGCL